MLIPLPILAILLLSTLLVAYSTGFKSGVRDGRKKEKARVEGLCHQAIQKRMSGTTRWVWNAVSDDREELRPFEEFFGPDGKKEDEDD